MPITLTNKEMDFVQFLLAHACPSDVKTETVTVSGTEFPVERRTFPIWLCCEKVIVVAEKVPMLNTWAVVSWETEQ
jgi:hypothetical protein